MRSAFYALINFINTSKVNDVYSNAAKIILENINKIPVYNITDVAEMCFCFYGYYFKIMSKIKL